MRSAQKHLLPSDAEILAAKEAASSHVSSSVSSSSSSSSVLPRGVSAGQLAAAYAQSASPSRAVENESMSEKGFGLRK